MQLTGSTGLWSGIGSLVYKYQWYRCNGDGAHCSAIHGATKTTYRTVPADSGKTLGFTVRATDSTGTASAYSSLFGPVAPAYPAVTSAAAPTLSGSAQPGSALSRWFHQRVGDQRGRARRIAIVALARKLLIALWRYVSHGVVPAGAVLKPV